MELSSLDFWYLAGEWQGLAGGRIQKIYHKQSAAGDVIVLQVYKERTYQWVFSDNASFLSTAKLTFPKSPSGFCMFLRKRLQGRRISAVALPSFDRIVHITVETKEGPAELIFELFQKMNCVLVLGGTIASALIAKDYSGRAMRRNAQYVPPPSKPAPWEWSAAERAGLVGKPAGKTFATDLSLGSRWSGELCSRLGTLPKEHLTSESVDRLAAVLSELAHTPLAPVENGAHALPFPFASLESATTWRPHPSFNMAVDAILGLQFAAAEETTAAQVRTVAISKRDKVLERQREAAEQLEQQLADSTRKAELLYEHYADVSELLGQLKRDWDRMPFAHLKEKYEKHPLVRRVTQDGNVDVEL